MNNNNIGKAGMVKKKKLVATRGERRRNTSFITLALLIIVVVSYVVLDSRSYIASVNDNRIMKYEYTFFLNQQISKTEQDQGIAGKTAAEKEAFWLKTEGGQNPWETAKSEALNLAKEYMVQLIKAREIGIRIDSSIKTEVDNNIKNAQGDQSASDFEKYVKLVTGVSLDQFRKISENIKLTERFRSEYIRMNYQPVTLTDNDMKTYYEKDKKVFDKVDIEYIMFSKTDKDGNKLADDVIKGKQDKAQAALTRVQAGEDMTKLIAEYFKEENPDVTPTGDEGKTSLPWYQDATIQPVLDFAFDNAIGKSSIVDTEEVIFVIKIVGRTDFEKVKADVKTYMESENQQKFFEEALNKWKVEPKYNIIKNDPIFDSISYKSIVKQ